MRCPLAVVISAALLSAQAPPTDGGAAAAGCTLQAGAGDGNFAAAMWPGGVVPYEFAANVTAAQQTAMSLAMQQLEGAAHVHFVPRGAEADYVSIRASSLNSSAVGRVGGLQVLHIAGWQHWTMVHELMHVLGFWHEHQRPDRDQYVAVQFNNVLPAQGYDFQIVPTGRMFGAYDFDSLLHFGTYEASSNSQPTLLVLPPNQQQQTAIGQRTHLSPGDLDALRLTYGSSVPPTITSLTPGSTTAWQPGNAVLQGLLFDEVTALWCGTQRVATFTRPQPDQIRFAVPAGLPIGTVGIAVESMTGRSSAVPLQITGNDPPVLEGPSVVVRGTFVNTFRAHGDDVRASLLLVSLLQQPSAVPGIVQLGIGGQFSNLFALGGPLVGDARGVATFRFPVPLALPANTTLYLQSLLFDPVHALPPLPASNVLTVRAF